MDELEQLFGVYYSSPEQVTLLHILIIYDVSDNRSRDRLVKFLQGYGFRVQKSAFEANISQSTFQRMLKVIGHYIGEEDSLRIYQLGSRERTYFFGSNTEVSPEELIVV